MAYALGSMAWSHTYLAAVEAIRWFIFSLLLWLGLNTLSRERLPLLALAVHGGAVVASLWAALQFWTSLPLFPQGPHPASTFVNRNFFAEFAVCTLPFGAVLLARSRRSAEAVLIARERRPGDHRHPDDGHAISADLAVAAARAGAAVDGLAVPAPIRFRALESCDAGNSLVCPVGNRAGVGIDPDR